MAGSVTVTRSQINTGLDESVRVEKIVANWTADAADGSVPNTNIPMKGYILKVVTNPGSTAPTANYDITLGDPEDSALDVLGGALANRHTTTTEQAYPTVSGAAIPIWVEGTHVLAIANNIVNSATGRIIFYLKPNL